MGDSGRQIRTAVVEKPGESLATEGCVHRNTGKHQFFRSFFLGFSPFRGLFGCAFFAHLSLAALGRQRGPENRAEEVVETIIAAERSRYSDIAADHREDRQYG